MKIDFDKAVKEGVEQAMRECVLTIGMMLKEAVEKQIPQRPLDFGDKAYLCPNCRRNNFYDGTETLNKTNFCNYCGQALDWSDKNGNKYDL